MSALNANRLANCQGRGLAETAARLPWPLAARGAPPPGLNDPARQAAAIRKVKKLARFCTAWSRAKYFPRKPGGTSAVIHGSQAQLEIPRERLKKNNSISISANRLSALRNTPVNGTSAIPKINVTRVPHPA